MLKRKISADRALMSTIIKVSVISTVGTIETNNHLEKVFKIFNDVVHKFSRFEKTSELFQLNSAGGEPFVASDEMFFLVKFGIDIARKSDGAFDPTIIDLLETYGYGANSNFDNLDNRNLVNEIREVLLTRKNWRQIKIDENTKTIKLEKGQKIDFGGYGKGYAVDLAYEYLSQFFDSFIINAGGDIRAKGQNEFGKEWKVGLLDEVALEVADRQHIKADPSFHGTIELHNKAIAASGGWARKIKFFNHLINPRTGLPVTDTKQVFVIADSAMVADAWATALFISGEPPKVLPDIEYLIIKKNGVCKSKDFRI